MFVMCGKNVINLVSVIGVNRLAYLSHNVKIILIRAMAGMRDMSVACVIRVRCVISVTVSSSVTLRYP